MNAISVHSACYRGLDVEEFVRFAAEEDANSGLLASAVTQAGCSQIRRILDREGRDLTSVCLPSAFTLGEVSKWEAERSRLCSVLDDAATLRAHCVYITTGPAGEGMSIDDAIGAFVDAVAPACEHARSIGVRLAVEPSSSLRHGLSCLFSLRDTLDVGEGLGLDASVEIANIWSERHLGELLHANEGRVVLAQVCDYAQTPRSLFDRRVPGDGVLPLGRVVQELIGSGYIGPFELEIFGPAIEEEGYRSAIRRSLAWLRNLLAQTETEIHRCTNSPTEVPTR